MMDGDDPEEDVVIEGSELYIALKRIGVPEFECTFVNRTRFPDDWQHLDDSKSQRRIYNCSRLLNAFQCIRNYFFRKSEDREILNGTEELKIILQLQPLLDDHSSCIQEILKSREDSEFSNTPSWRILSGSLMLAGLLLSPDLRVPGFITAFSLSTLTVYQKYSERSFLRNLKNLVSTENNLFHLQKKSLKILRNGYGMTLDSNPSRRKFTELELNRLQHLQPLCEDLCRCIEHCSRTFYKTSHSVIDLSPIPLDSTRLINILEDDSLKIQGEITSKKLEQFYYTYILTQSDMMNVLSVVLSGSTNRGMKLKLSRIIINLQRTLKHHEEKLSSVIKKYQSSKTVTIPRRKKRTESLKYRELYMHVDLLSRKLQTAYATVSSILEDIDNISTDETPNSVDSLVLRMNEAYKQLDTARDFAEFNILVMKKLQNNREPQIPHGEPEESEERKQLPVIFDADPQVMDECFEEYIREEYLKPLCQDDDGDVERAKMDKLLERNFMRELKGVLVDKYRSMSEREAKALLRYRKDLRQDKFCEAIPVPPPLPRADEVRHRLPVPLPRRVKAGLGPERDAIGDMEPQERLSIRMAIGERVAFTVDEETFVGSGENSEEELAGSGCEDDEIIE
uniref:Gcp protein n=1 Tax=Fopius arisanus TaxID=64838 RepID=A0A0C9PXV3_9HYME